MNNVLLIVWGITLAIFQQEYSGLTAVDFESVKAQHKGFLTLLSSHYNKIYAMKQLSN